MCNLLKESEDTQNAAMYSDCRLSVATLLAWIECLNSQNAQKCLREGAKSDLGSLGRGSQKSLSHRANLVSHQGKHPKTGFRTVQEIILGPPLQSKTPFAPSLKHFWAFWLFRHLCHASGLASLVCTEMLQVLWHVGSEVSFAQRCLKTSTILGLIWLA